MAIILAISLRDVSLFSASSGSLIRALGVSPPDHWSFTERLRAEFNGGGNRIATSSEHSVQLWDGRNGTAIKTLVAEQIRPLGVAPTVTSASLNNKWPPFATFSSVGLSVLIGGGSDELAYAEIYDASNGAQKYRLAGQKGTITSAAFTEADRLIVTTSTDNNARLWKAEALLSSSPSLKATLSGHQDWVTGATFDPQKSRVVTVSRDKTARLWGTGWHNSGLITTLTGHTDEVQRAFFNADSSRLATRSRDHTLLWDVSASSGVSVGQLVAKLDSGPDYDDHAVFSPSGALLMVNGWQAVRLFDAKTGKLVATLDGHGGRVFAAAFNPSGTRIVTADNDNTARIWDGVTGAALAILAGHTGRVLSASFSHDGDRVVTASEDKTVRVWDLNV